MRLRVLDLPLNPDDTARFALVVDLADPESLLPEFHQALTLFAQQIGAAGVLVTDQAFDVASMTPLYGYPPVTAPAPGGLLRALADKARDVLTDVVAPRLGSRLI